MKNIIIMLFTYFLATSCYAQEQTTKSSNNSYFKIDNKKELNRNLLLTSSSINNISLQSNFNIEHNSNNNIVNLTQVGYNNIAEIQQTQLSKQVVKQIGNRNSYSFIDYKNSMPVSFGVSQLGNNNTLQIYGTNSLMNGLKITQQTNAKNIVIKNYR